MRLSDAPFNKTVRVIGVEGGGLQSKLSQYGLFKGDCLCVIRSAPLDGPLLIEINGRTIALGRRVTKKVIVEEVNCESR
ncbi:MAG: ferrous iron transport protein A [Chloroflexi bacterium]|nr:ferrous iron transport protein A [Chloroflexota bacterium]